MLNHSRCCEVELKPTDSHPWALHGIANFAPSSRCGYNSGNMPTADRFNARIGLALFAIYLIIYAAFVYLCAFRADVMAREIGGINLAVLYGMGLIIAAFVLAMVYSALCKRSDEPESSEARRA